MVKDKLSNGVTVLLCPRIEAETACVLTLVKTGYLDEPDEKLGISHLIEHLFFGSASLEAAQRIQDLGGYVNAATHYDHTYYYSIVPCEHVTAALEVHANAFSHPNFTFEAVEREKLNVIQEIEQKQDNTDAFVWEQLLGLAFAHHPIRRWRLGKAEALHSFSPEEILNHFKNFYVAENTIVAVVGNFDLDSTILKIKENFGTWTSSKMEKAEAKTEPVQDSPKLLRITEDVSRVLIKMGFHAPSLMDDEYPSMQALSILLGTGRSSRFYRSLKEEKGVVFGVTTSYFTSEQVGYFVIEAELTAELIALCEEEIWVELDRLYRDPPSTQEMKRIHNIVESDFWRSQQDSLEYAHQLAYFEALGGMEKFEKYINDIRELRAEDLIRTAGKIFHFSNMSLLEYVPKTLGKGFPAQARLESLRKRVNHRIEKAGPRLEPEDTETSSYIVTSRSPLNEVNPPITVDELGTGPVLVHQRLSSLPLVTVSISFPGGRLDETLQNCGITNLVLRASLRGTENHTADELALETETLGTQIEVDAAADYFGYSFQVLPQNLEKALKLLSDILLHPTFPERELETERAAILGEQRTIRDDIFRRPIELFYQALFGLHAYGLPRFGTEDSVYSFTRSQVLNWYEQVFQWSKMTVSIVGDISRQKAMGFIQEWFAVQSDGPSGERAQIFPVVPARGVREKVEERNRSHTGIAFGFQGVPIKNNSFFTLEVLRSLLAGKGGRFNSKAHGPLEGEKSFSVFNLGLLRDGAFFAHAVMPFSREREVSDQMVQEFHQLQRKLVTNAELFRAKAFAKGSHSLLLGKYSARANTLIQAWLAGLGKDWVIEYADRIDRVTPEAVLSMARELFNPERHAVGVVRGSL